MTGSPAWLRGFSKSDCCNGEQRLERRPPLVLGASHDHLTDDRQPVVGHEHVLGAAEADAFGAELARLRRILRRVRVRPDAQPASLVGPPEDGLGNARPSGRDTRHPSGDDAPAAAVDRDHVSSANTRPSITAFPRSSRSVRVATGHGRLAHPAGDNRRVRRHPAVRGKDAARPDEAVDVVRRRLPAHEDDVVLVAAALLRRVRVEYDGAGRRAG